MTTATVITDASFHITRKGGSAFAGWAAWVRVDGILKPIRGYGAIRNGLCVDSTEAEMYAALNGIWLAATNGAQNILVRSDCMTVVYAIDGGLKSPRLKQLWREGLAEGNLLGVTLTSRHVKGHGEVQCAATYVNDWCDRHARLAQRDARRGKFCQIIS